MTGGKMRSILWVATLGSGCMTDPEVVTLDGKVWTSHEDATALAGAKVQVLDGTGANFAKATTNAKGAFAVDAPWGAEVFALVSAEGHRTTSFSGVTGIEDRLALEEGEFHGMPNDEWAAWVQKFEGCDGLGAGGALVGEARFLEIRDTVSGEYPLVETLSVQVEGSDGVIYRGCYLDAGGALYDPGATTTGATGMFGVFGLPPGGAWIDLEYLFVEVDGERYTYEVSYLGWVPEDGVLPRFPFWLQVLL